MGEVALYSCVVPGSRSRVQGLGSKVQGLGCRVQGLRFRVQSLARPFSEPAHGSPVRMTLILFVAKWLLSGNVLIATKASGTRKRAELSVEAMPDSEF